MLMLFVGLSVSVIYGVVSFAFLYYHGGKLEAEPFFTAYTDSFKTVISLGLSIGTALIVYCSQIVVPNTIENAFEQSELSQTLYGRYRRRFFSPRKSLTFSGFFFIVAFVIFSYSEFPLSRAGQAVMIFAACVQYALGVYIGRKLVYAGMMLHSLLSAEVTRNLFKRRELNAINPYVHIVSTLTIIFVYIHVVGYYTGPFRYGSVLGQSIKPFLMLPAIIATPVLLIFNFYPREVLRKLYSESIDVEIQKLNETLRNERLTAFEKRSHLIEFDKMCRDELRYSLKLTLSDLPFGVAILIMVLEVLLRR